MQEGEGKNHLYFKIIKSTEVYLLKFIVRTLMSYIYVPRKQMKGKVGRSCFCKTKTKTSTHTHTNMTVSGFCWRKCLLLFIFPLPELLVFLFSILPSFSCKSKFPIGPLSKLPGKQSSNCKTGGLDGSQFYRSLHCKPSHKRRN